MGADGKTNRRKQSLARDTGRGRTKSSTIQPPEEIEKLRNIAGGGKIDPNRKYQFALGNGKIMEWTGAELIETAEALVALADADKRGDKIAMLAALKRMGTA